MSMYDEIEALVKEIDAEPKVSGQIATAAQIGRFQVRDDLNAILMRYAERKPYRVTYGIPGAWTTDGDHTVEAIYPMHSLERAMSFAEYMAELHNLVVINVEEISA